jgi:hypothetical protein
MKQGISFGLYIILFACIACTCSGSGESTMGNSPNEIVFVGSTPGDEVVKSLLTIPASTKVDFILWNLTLNTSSDQNTFILKIAFGESQPNTMGFKIEEHLSFEGTYSFALNTAGNINGEIYRLESQKLPAGISMVQLNDNLFHLLSPTNHLVKGNGGWSYTLNREQPVITSALPNLTSTSTLITDTSLQVIFEGRTPCLVFAGENNLTVASDCFKLKWKLLLNRDPKTRQPTTYLLQRTNTREKDISGKWTIIKGSPSNPNALILLLDPDNPENKISLLVGDDNVLFFLNRDNQLYVGNGDFSFTLNKRSR